MITQFSILLRCDFNKPVYLSIYLSICQLLFIIIVIIIIIVIVIIIIIIIVIIIIFHLPVAR